jgi:hypothetical protein
MANPTVEKLQKVALRYADKVAVALTAVLCLVFVFLALSKETIETTPDDLSEVANRAQQNINTKQDEKAILERIEQDGMVLQGFGPKVAERETKRVDVREFSLARSFVKAEPGAGLIRDSVKEQLLAPYNLVATAGRGGIPFAARDAQGNLLPPDPEQQEKIRSGMFGMMSGMGEGRGGMSGMMSGMGMGGTGKQSVRQEQFAKRQEQVASSRKKAAVAGGLQAPPEEEEETAAELVDYKIEVRGQRWVAIVGLINNKQFRERFAKALKISEDSPESHPDYKRIEMERQAFDPVTGGWSDWSLVDPEALEELTADVAFEEDAAFEMTPDPVRLPPIVSFLPFLSSGYWTGVHHGELIPAEKVRELLAENDEETQNMNAMGGMGMMGNSGMGMMGNSGMGMMGGMGEMGMGGMEGMGMMGNSGMGMMSGMGMSGMGMMGGMGRPAGAGPEHMTQEEIIMARGLDYTVRPDTTYRYRLRVVVGNPNFNREDVAHGVDNEAREFAGPWSEVTDPVKVPADVAIYAMNPAQGGAYRAETVNFDVVAWNPKSGSLAVSSFPAAPGEFIGKPADRLVAQEGEDEPKSETINFQSRELVIDTMGGQQPVQNLSVGGRPLSGSFEIPAVVAVLRPDGTLALHNQAVDATDEQLTFMRESYNLSISNELNKKSRGNDMGMMMMGGGMSGMMGGSY